jgi:predicted dehydrogenase
MMNVALIGVAGYGWNLRDAIQAAGRETDCRLIAAAEALPERCKSRIRELRDEGVEMFDDAVRMFAALQGQVDAVFIATGIASHEPLTVQALQAGYNVHVEKPPAATVQEMDSMERAAAETGGICLVGFQSIHSSELRMLKSRLVSGELGKIRKISCWASWPRADFYYARTPWAGNLRSGDRWVLDSPTNNALAHQVNNMLYLAGENEECFATPAAVRAELYAAGAFDSHNTGALEIRTQHDQKLYFLATHCGLEPTNPSIHVECEKGRAEYHFNDHAIVHYADGREESFGHDKEHRTKMVLNLLDAVTHDEPSRIRCGLADTRNFVLAIDGAHESSGRVHRIPNAAVKRIEDAKGKRIVVEGLTELLEAAGCRGCLISDLDDAPDWAVQTEPFDLTEYNHFPQRFDG